MTVEELDAKEGWLIGKCPHDNIYDCLNAYERERYIRLVFKAVIRHFYWLSILETS